MSTAALCKGKQSRSVFNIHSGHRCVWVSPIILSWPTIIVYELADPGHSAICSDSIDAEIRGVGQEGAGTHMFSGQSGDASPVSLSPRAGLLDQTAEGR